MVVIKFVYIEQCWFNKHIKEPYILHYPSSGCSFKAVSFVSRVSTGVLHEKIVGFLPCTDFDFIQFLIYYTSCSFKLKRK